MSPENSSNHESRRKEERKRKIVPHLFEAVKTRLGMDDDSIENPIEQQVIIPLEGLEDKTYSLPERDEEGNQSNEYFHDWIMTDETADDAGNIYVSLSRYSDDGSVDSRVHLPADIFESFQTKADADQRFKKSGEDEGLGATPTEMDRIRMVRDMRAQPEWSELLHEEQASIQESRARLDARRAESLARIKEERDKKRRENPMRYLLRGKHHKGTPRNDSEQ